MATVQEGLRAALAGVAGGRVYPAIAPDGAAAPFLVYTRISAVPATTFAGRPIANTRFQVDIYASTYANAQTTRDATVAALDAWAVRSVILSEADIFEDETKTHRVSLDLSVWT